MWNLFIDSIKLFYRRRLFANHWLACRQIFLGVLAVFTFTVLARLLGAPIWFAALAGGFLGGATTPFLCINLRMQ